MVYFQQFINGLSIGGIYALFAVGLALLFGVAGLLNFAHGEFYMLGAYAAWLGTAHLRLPYAVAIIFSVIALITIAEVIRRTTGVMNDHSFETMILMTLAISLVMQNAAFAIWGPGIKGVSAIVDEPILLGSLALNPQRIFVLIISLAACIALDMWTRKSRAGKSMNAIAQNRTVALSLGINVRGYGALALAISAGLAGLAGAAIVPITYAFPLMGFELIIKGFAAVIVAGLKNIRGAMIIALSIGVLEAITTQLAGLVARDLVAYVVLMIALLWRPAGLFSRAGRKGF